MTEFHQQVSQLPVANYQTTPLTPAYYQGQEDPNGRLCVGLCVGIGGGFFRCGVGFCNCGGFGACVGFQCGGFHCGCARCGGFGHCGGCARCF